MDEELRERLISSRPVFEGRLLSVKVDEVALANGNSAIREIVSHPGAAAIVPLLNDDHVVMIRQYRHAAGKVLWEIPAGILEEGESPEACARRELAEEVGYAANDLDFLFSVFLSPGFSSELIHVFLARNLVPVKVSAEEDERIEAHRICLDEAVKMVRQGEVQNATAVCGLLAAFEHMRRFR